jgi:arsenate reductase (thioredoxin)
MTTKPRLLILCMGNSARSQMAEGLLRYDGGDCVDVASAGTQPRRVRPEAIQVMRELGIDISWQRSKSVEEFIGQDFDYVITVCDTARQSCPVFPGETTLIHWSIEDPAATEGDEQARLALFRRVRDELRERLRGFIAAHVRSRTMGRVCMSTWGVTPPVSRLHSPPM